MLQRGKNVNKFSLEETQKLIYYCLFSFSNGISYPSLALFISSPPPQCKGKTRKCDQLLGEQTVSHGPQTGLPSASLWPQFKYNHTQRHGCALSVCLKDVSTVPFGGHIPFFKIGVLKKAE